VRVRRGPRLQRQIGNGLRPIFPSPSEVRRSSGACDGLLSASGDEKALIEARDFANAHKRTLIDEHGRGSGAVAGYDPAGAVLLFLLPIGWLGCSLLPFHVHDSERAAETAAVANLLDQYGAKSPGIYDTMFKNSRAIASQQDQVLVGLGENRCEFFTGLKRKLLKESIVAVS
jgi:hypothetical protein